MCCPDEAVQLVVGEIPESWELAQPTGVFPLAQFIP
jgi:hypothetical protein